MIAFILNFVVVGPFFFLRIFTTYTFALNWSAIVIIFLVHTGTSYNSLVYTKTIIHLSVGG